MTTPTMVYKAATDASEPTHVVETESGKWEWLIVDLEDGEGPPDGWQSLPYVAETTETAAPKPKRSKIKLPTDPEHVTEGTDGNRDGN